MNVTIHGVTVRFAYHPGTITPVPGRWERSTRPRSTDFYAGVGRPNPQYDNVAHASALRNLYSRVVARGRQGMLLIAWK